MNEITSPRNVRSKAESTTVLVVDDSALYRQSIQNVLRDVDGVKTVGSARNGVQALEKIDELDPDLLTLDVQMPDMDGIELLREIKRRRMRTKAIMVSSFTATGADVTTTALMEGAFDFVLKPFSNDWEANRRQLSESLVEKIGAFRESRGGGENGIAVGDSTRGTTDTAPTPSSACQAVIIGTSTGGPAALKTVLPKIPANLKVPVLVVQHMPAKYTESLARRLDSISEADVIEATDGAEALPGQVLVAPGGQQMKLRRDASGSLRIRVTDDPPLNGVRPSVDYLVASACKVLDGNALAVIMTGMGSDGLSSCRQLSEAGGFVFAQSQEGCVVYGMPRAIIAAGIADRVLPLGKIAPAIVRHVKRSIRG